MGSGHKTRSRRRRPPFQPVGHGDATEKHAVCQQVVTAIGAGKSGSDVRKSLGGAPFGWPRDAVDAALIALHRLQHITATLNGQAIALGQLDQNKIPKTEFESRTVDPLCGGPLVLRKLFQGLRISTKGGEEGSHADEFLSALTNLAKSAAEKRRYQRPLRQRRSTTSGVLPGTNALSRLRIGQ